MTNRQEYVMILHFNIIAIMVSEQSWKWAFMGLSMVSLIVVILEWILERREGK